MALSWTEAQNAVLNPGSGTPFELMEEEVFGVKMEVFKHAPQNLALVLQGARAHGDKTFLLYEGERFTFANVMDQVDGLAHLLVNKYGIKKGDRVAVAMRNYPEWIISFAAIVSVGAVNVSFNAWWTEDEMDFALKDCGAKVLIGDQQRIDTAHHSCRALGIKMLIVRPETEVGPDIDEWAVEVKSGLGPLVADIQPDDDCTILYTSGTTGRPKGAVSTHRAVVSALMAFSARNGVLALASDPPAEPVAPDPFPPSFILIVPLFHVTGCVPVMLSCFFAGLKLVIMYKWDAGKALPIIQDEQITNFVGVPTQSWDLVNHPDFAKYDTSSLRAVGGGGAPAPAALVDKVAKSVKKGSPQLGYGMTETNAFGPGNVGKFYTDRPTSTGRAIRPMEVAVWNPETKEVLGPNEYGEIMMFGPMLIRGYWNRPDATAEAIENGWLHTGDGGYIDEDGFLFIKDRIKDMILRGGENVFCSEVEGSIYEHPSVHEAAVFGVPHERLGEEVAVAIRVKDDASLTAEDLWKFLDGKISSFKVPNHVVIMNEELPRNAAGKFLKTALRDMVANGQLKPTSR
ncbi:MAG: acyl--CoA ligase [Ilumatobacteraceae bacterium]|jgi:long-chain acyl-CoA synthetase|nr:acyl--CoA ligase [Ilumatobacteraceae bacterium]